MPESDSEDHICPPPLKICALTALGSFLEQELGQYRRLAIFLEFFLWMGRTGYEYWDRLSYFLSGRVLFCEDALLEQQRE